jgi:hypothetical protein
MVSCSMRPVVNCQVRVVVWTWVLDVHPVLVTPILFRREREPIQPGRADSAGAARGGVLSSKTPVVLASDVAVEQAVLLALRTGRNGGVGDIPAQDFVAAGDRSPSNDDPVGRSAAAPGMDANGYLDRLHTQLP